MDPGQQTVKDEFKKKAKISTKVSSPPKKPTRSPRKDRLIKEIFLVHNSPIHKTASWVVESSSLHLSLQYK